VQLGGYGFYGPLAGTLSTNAAFNRAFNVSYVSGSSIDITAQGNSILVNNNYVMGIGEAGDSGSGLWLDTGAQSDTNLWDYDLIGALDTTSSTNAFGSTNQYASVPANSSWLLSTAYAGHATVTWDVSSTTAGVQDGGGTWDLSTPNWGNGVSNFAWDNGVTTMNANFGAHSGAAGTVTLGADVTVQNMQFNPALSGTYTIVSSGSFTLGISSTTVITNNANATISAPISGGGGTLTKLGPCTLTLAVPTTSANTFTGTLLLGDGATSGNNGNGTVRIASSTALNGVTEVSWTDNTSAYDNFQLDGTTANGNVTIPSSVDFSWNANNDGPAATAATMLENIGGNNVINSAITGNTGGIGYGIASDAGSITFTGSFSIASTKTLFFRGAGNGTFSDVISGSAVGINITDSGTWTLDSPNTYGDSTTIAGGVLSTSLLANGGAASGIGESSNAAANLVLSGGTLSYIGPGASTNRLFTVGPAGATIDGSGSAALDFSNTGSILCSDAATHDATTVAGSNMVTITAGGETDLAIGMAVTGTGIPSGATITAVNQDAGTIALSASATAAGSPMLSFGAVNRTLTLTGSTAVSNTLTPGLANSAAGGLLGLTKTGAGTWALGGVNTNTGPTLVSVGTLTLSSDASLASPIDMVSSGAVFNVNGSLSTSTALAANGSINFGAADLNNDPSSTILPRSVGAVTIGSGGDVEVATAASSTTRSVLIVASALTNNGTLALANNDMIVRSGDVSAITNQVVSGAISSAAQSMGNTTLAVVLNTAGEFSTFDNQSVSSGDVLVKYTYYGDALLTGSVTAADYVQIDNGFNSQAGADPLSGWYNGDFNYDGVINGDDYTLIDNAFNSQGSVSYGTATAGNNVEMIAGATSQISAVPEPATIILLALAGGAGLLRSRRRR
jgi:autotransporter-associated beta strand protein